MKVKNYFLHVLFLMALIVPWATQAQNAKVSEYEGVASSAAYSSIVGTTGATSWTAADKTAGYVDVQMPFAMYFGENQIASGSTLRVYDDGSAAFTSLTDSRIAPLYYSSGYNTTATSVYTKSSAQQLVVEWRKVVSGDNSYSFQLKLYPGGDVEFCYGPMTINSSISVLVGMMSSATDIYRVGGANGGYDWSDITRYTTGTTTRTLSTTYAPAYDVATNVGMVYTFTQPACVKPTSATATALAWNSIKVDWTVSSPGNGFQVKYSTDASFDPDNEGQTKTVSSGTDTTTNITGLQGGTTYYFYVRKVCGSTPSGWSQMATATTPTGCPTLSGINSTAVTATGATLYWTTSVAATSYEVRYNLGADFDPYENEGTLVTSTDTAKTLTGLTGASTYYYYVRAICVSSLTTNWYGPYIVNTLCGTQNTPYSITFNNTSMPSCWSSEIVEGSTDWSFTSGSYAYFNYTDGAVGRLITPIFDISAAGNYQVEFYHAETYDGTADDSLYVYYRTSATGEWVRLAELGSHQAYGSINYSQTILALPNPSAAYQLAFEGRGHYGYGVYLGSVSVGLEPTCPTPSGIAATTEGVVTWTAGNNNTSYDLVYGPAGFSSLEEGTLIQNISGTTYTLPGLVGSTSYDVYVRAHCSATNETNDTWVGPANFTTPCMAMNISATEPFVEGFEGTTIPGCWSIEYVNGTHDWVFNSYGDYSTATGTHSGSHNALFKHTTTGTVTRLVSPIFNFASGSYALNFWHIQRSWSGDIDNLKIYYRTSLSGEWILLQSYTGAIATWTQEEIALVNTSSTYQIAFEATDNYGYGVALDDITIMKLADCLNPVGLAASGLTATEATLTWTPRGTATQWEVKVGPRGFNPDEAGTSYIVNTTPTLALTYLYMLSEYDAYVRAICDPEGPTEWSNVCEFKTLCPNGGNVTMGTGTTSTSGVILNSSWGNTYCQQIFTADELATAGLQAGDIAGITFTWSSNGTYQKDLSIYMGNTTQENFSSTTAWVPIASQTLVYGPTLRPTSGTSGEQEYLFTTPFTWDGTSNIVISTFVNQHGGSQTGSGFYSYTTNSGKTNVSMWKYRDSQAFTESEVDAIAASSRSGYRASIKLIRPCDTGSCNAPNTVITLSETEYAATLTFTDVNGETNPSYGIIYGPQGFDPTTAGTTVSPITNATYTISNLAARTSYDVYVYAICSGTNGRMVKYNFVTPFIPNCKTPIIDGTYGASNIAYNTATLTWRQPGDVPQFWTVRYADADFDPSTAAATDYTELTIQGTAGATAQLTGLVAGTTYYVYIKATCATAPDLDESPWLSMNNANPAYTFTTPACVEPTAVTASNVTNSTAQINWTSNATAWTLKYGLAGFDPDNEGTEVACTADSIVLTGLDAAEKYDVYVKSNCTATDESDWSDVCSFATVCPGVVPGSEYTVTIGTGTTVTSGVINTTNWGNTYCQQIFTADELIAAGVQPGNITSLTFTWNQEGSYEKDFSIYMANTTQGNFSTTTAWVPIASQTLVYGPTLRPITGTAGEVEYILDNAFAWDGASNIVVTTFINQHGGNQSNSGFGSYSSASGSSNMSMWKYRDNSAFTIDEVDGLTASSRSGNRANITFKGAVCDPTISCFAPATVSTSITPANVVTVTWAPRTDLLPVVNNFELKYGFQGFNPDNQGAGTLVTNLNNVFNYIITAELNYDADYDVYVRTVCGGGNNSHWTKASFHTNPSCWAPTALAVTGTTTNSATLSWTENTPIAATRWEVAYGLEGFDPDRVEPVETTNNSAFVVNGLKHSTKYEFYVRAKCSNTDHSPWSEVATATTQCGVWQYEDMPLVENFDGYTGNTSTAASSHVLPNCWAWINGGSSYAALPSINNGSGNSASTPNCLRFYRYNSTSTSYRDQFAILPQFGFNLDTLVVAFSAKMSNVNAKFYLGTMSDPTDSTTFHEITAITAPNTSYNDYEISLADYQINTTDRYLAFVQRKSTGSYNVYLDDLTVKLREKINMLADNGQTINACNEFVMPDTTNGGSYHNGLNTTYVVRPATAGKVAHITGSFDLENGYDFLNVYRGAVNANNLVGRYTGTGTIDFMTGSNLWADSGYVTLVLTTDADNAFNYEGFKLLVQCECPNPDPEVHTEVVEANGTYTWRNGQTYTNNVVHSYADYNAEEMGITEPDLLQDVNYTYVNVAGCDSVEYALNLTVHPTYSLTYSKTICERDEVNFYGQVKNATNTYTVPLTSQYGADSTGILILQVNPAPSAAIYKGGEEVTEITGHCDNAALTLLARSNNNAATFAWEDNSTADTRVVYPHESNTYTVVATNPTTGCTSLPATVTVTTTPVPELAISGEAEICYGQSTTLTLADANNVPATYRWNTGATGTSITVNPTATTTYSVTATTSNTSACTATAEFTVTVNPLPVVTATASASQICRDSIVTLTATDVAGYSYSWNTGATTAVATIPAAATGVYTVTVTDQNGCVNEFQTANVTVYPSYELDAEMSVCYTHNPYTWEGMTITANGSYDQMLQTRTPGRPMQCDSLVHLTFTFEEMGIENSNIEVCQGNTYTFENITRTATADTNLTYIDYSGDCPVQYNLSVKVNPVKATTVPHVVCDTYTWNVSGETYTTSGEYPVTLSTSKGCDSVVTLALTVNYQNTGVETVTACDSYEWDLNGVTYTATTSEPTFTLHNQWGCDSVVTLDLTVNYRSYHEDFHCVSDAKSYTWLNGRTYNLNVNVADSIQFVTGTNAVECNEIALLHLIMNPVLDTLAWVDVEACDEYVVDNAVTVNQESCTGIVEPLYLRESGDYEIRTRANDGHDQWTRIHLTVNQSTYHTTVATECLPYTWTIYKPDSTLYEVATITADDVNGAAIYNTSIDLAEAGFTTSSCSTIEVLRLTPKYPTAEVTDTVTICSNDSWTAGNSIVFKGTEYASGIYTWDNSTLNADGCPLTKQVDLTVNPAVRTTAELTFCENEFVLDTTTNEYKLTVTDAVAGHNGTVELTIPGALDDTVYTNTVDAMWQTVLGCDSIVTITYTVNPMMHVNEVVADACHEYTWNVTGITYTESNTYTKTLTNDSTGCKVVHTLDLTVLGTSEGYDTIEVCTSYVGPDSVTYYVSHSFDVTYKGTLPIVNGCDSITHLTYNVRQSALFENNVVTNQPYTWVNGETYTQNVSNIYYQLPDTDGDGCVDVLVLDLKMVDSIVLCDNQLPYTWTLGETSFTIADGSASGVWSNGNADGNDTIIAYTINNTDATPVAVTACDSYVWATNATTYTESGVYEYTATNAAGCDSVITLTLTINTSTAGTVADTACDSYTWAAANGGNDSTYTVSGTYVNTIDNVLGCDSVITLNLIINKNNGAEVTVNNGCDSYTWTDGDGMTYTASGNYSFQFTDANGCVGDSVLHLTINPSYETYDTLVVNEGGSYTYLGVMYSSDNGAVDTTITHTFQSINGCDSVNHLRLIIPVMNDIVEINVEACGTYTWAVADGGTGHTYSWIPMSERQSHGMALYKDITANRYVYSYPMDTTFGENHVMTQVRVLHLNLLESTSSSEVVDVPVSLGHYDIMNVIDNTVVETVNFTYADRGTSMTLDHPVGVGSVFYCDDYRTFTFNIIDNYDTTSVYACSDATSYEWNSVAYTIGEPGHTYYFAQKENEGTMNELVHVLKVNQRAVNAETITETACDSYTWTSGDSNTYTNSVAGVVYNYTDANGCAATKTLNLTIKHNTSFAYSADVCDTYTWTRNNQVYTATGDYFYNYTDTNNCAAVDTLHLTIRNNTNTTFDTAVCVSYIWSADKGGDGRVCDSTAVYTYNYTAANECPSVNTLNLTINMPANDGETLTACDSTEWHGTKYYTSGTYYYNYNTTAGCASVDTLYLTVNNATNNSETLTQCDSYEWHGTTYTTSGDYQYSYNNTANCPSVDTLHLTINVNTSTINDTVTACDEYTWAVNDRLYNASGNFTARTTDTNGCATTNTLALTINRSSSYDSVLYISDGSYRYYGQSTTELFGEGVYNRDEHYTNVAGCDSTLSITFNIGTARLGIDNVVNCNQYTWRNGETYVWISDEERNAHRNNENDAPLYKTVAGEYVYYNPTYTVPQENDYDSIYMLALTLTQSFNGTDEVTLNISDRQLVYGNDTLNFDTLAVLQQEFVNTDKEFDIHFPAVQHCDSIIALTVHLVNNYQEVVADRADICVTTTSYEWRNHTVNTATNDYDHAHVYYMYDTLASGIIEYITVNQRPLAYATERRTACDEYTWNGTTYTESTSNATAYFPAGTVINAGTPDEYTLICDSTVTLILTINKNSSTKFADVAACESYTWIPTNAADSATYTASGTYYSPVYYTNKGCASVDTLVLTVNYKTSTAMVVDACDSYTWTEGTNITYTATDTFYYSYPDAQGICTSVDTLYLTIRNNSNKSYTKVACDAYTWADTLGGDGQTYTASGVYYYNYDAANGCPSTNTLNLTVNQNSGHTDTIVACDSVQWHGTWYYADNNTATYDYVDNNLCPSVDVLNLTINQATHNVFTEVACNSYTWDNNGNSNTYTVSGVYTSEYNNGLCASVDTLHLTIGNGHAYSRDTVIFCGPYTWIVEDSTIGVYTESVQTATTVMNPATGCDSTIFLSLTINPQNVTEVAICDNESYLWTVDSMNYTDAGTYDVSETDNNGNCISNERLILTVNPTAVTDLTDQICLGNGYTANGFDIAASDLPNAGVYNFVDHRTTAAGCEHTYNLTLTVGDVINNPVEAVACDSYDWTAGDSVVYNFTESGTYTSEPYANAAGCTTVDVLTLTINQNAGTEYTETACDGFMWNGTQYTESGDYQYNYTDGNGCASTDVLHLTINNSAVETIEKVACDNFEWTDGNGEVYDESTVATYTTTTTAGCTLTKVLVLTINHNSSTEYTATACDSYVWENDGQTYTTSGDYTFDYEDANGCASTDILHLTVNSSTDEEVSAKACSFYNWKGQTYTVSGDYEVLSTNDAGCTHTDILHLIIEQPVVVTIDTTVCGYLSWNGISYDESDVITHHFTAVNGCDSTEIINLTVNSVSSAVVAATACESYTWDANGTTYTTGGSKVAILSNAAANGCDSVVTLTLTLNHGTHNVETATACDSYTWNGTAYTTSGNYTYNYDNASGCASVDTLVLTINNSVTGSEAVTACDSYTWNGTTYTTSGNYTHTYTAANGCDSVATLALTINTHANVATTVTACDSYTWNGQTYTASGDYIYNVTGTNGCTGTDTLHLTVNYNTSSAETVSACDSYTWNGTTYNQSGVFTFQYNSASSCPSVDTLYLTVKTSKTSNITAAACNMYLWNGMAYTTSGNYTQTLTAANGCDSVVTMALTINTPVYSTISATNCDSYTWNNVTYTTSGNYTQTFTSAAGCDSIVTLNLTITPAVTYMVNLTVCDSYTWNGTNYTTSGNYTHTYTSAAGCDSVVVLALTVKNSTTSTATVEACDSYTWIDGQTYTASTTTPTYTLTNAIGCDSIVTLHLTIKSSTTGVDEQTACGSYTWIDGQTYTASTTTPTYTLTAANGCDSVVTLNLTVNYNYDLIDEVAGCDSYTWIDGQTYTASTNTPTVTYTAANGCDSTITLNLTINHSVEVFDTINILQTELPYNYNGYTIEDAGDYVFNGTTETGCDSTVYLHVDVTLVGIDVVDTFDDITVYPNPTRGRLTITADDVVKVEVLDIVGRRVALFENTNTFDISNLGQGAYTLRITLPNGTTVRKVVKK